MNTSITPSRISEGIRHILSKRQKISLAEPGWVPAAVLVALFEKEGQPYILFTRRTDNVEYHKGQICFPGGGSEIGESKRDTALREAFEEIGLKPEDVELLGELDDTKAAVSGFIISPFVAHIPYPYRFKPNPLEIKDILEIPLAALRKKNNWTVEERVMENGTTNQVYFVECGGLVVWGATAKIVKQLIDLLPPGVERDGN
jgi:8-oxo-dGTP pyrophosphatase MutT (NUDIX family)